MRKNLVYYHQIVRIVPHFVLNVDFRQNFTESVKWNFLFGILGNCYLIWHYRSVERGLNKEVTLKYVYVLNSFHFFSVSNLNSFINKFFVGNRFELVK